MASPTIDQFSGLVASVAIKAPVRVTTTGAITLSGLQNIDGVALVDGDRVLVNNQTDGSQNGIWNAAVGDWSRAADCDDNNDLVTGTQVRVTGGTLGAGVYNLTSLGDIVIGTSLLTFSLAPTGGGGGGGPVTGGINVGDFGLGGTSANYVEVTNANAATTQGFYTVPSSWTGAPIAGVDVNNQGYLEVQPWESSSYCRQTFTSTSGTRLQRVLNNGTWSSWDSYYLPLAGGTVAGSLGVAGTLTAGSIVSGAITASASVKVTGTNSKFLIGAVAGTNSLLEFDVGTAARWALGRGSATETGTGNAGSDFALLSYNDAGTLIGTALSVVRASMAANFGGTLSENGARVYSANNPPPGSGTSTDYTSSTTWTKPAAGRTVLVECWAGGGGGGRAINSGNGAAGGGGGAYQWALLPFSLLAATVAITVGAGGAGATTAGGAGGAGGNSSFGGWQVSAGGAGGPSAGTFGPGANSGGPVGEQGAGGAVSTGGTGGAGTAPGGGGGGGLNGGGNGAGGKVRVTVF